MEFANEAYTKLSKRFLDMEALVSLAMEDYLRTQTEASRQRVITRLRSFVQPEQEWMNFRHSVLGYVSLDTRDFELRADRAVEKASRLSDLLIPETEGPMLPPDILRRRCESAWESACERPLAVMKVQAYLDSLQGSELSVADLVTGIRHVASAYFALASAYRPLAGLASTGSDQERMKIVSDDSREKIGTVGTALDRLTTAINNSSDQSKAEYLRSHVVLLQPVLDAVREYSDAVLLEGNAGVLDELATHVEAQLLAWRTTSVATLPTSDDE